VTDDEALTAVAEALEAGDADELARIEALLDAQDTARRERLTRPEALAEAAAWYASQGIAVFPLHPGSKVPITSTGFKAATTDSDRVTEWWRRTPQANIGLPTGVSFDVIDVDGPAGVLALAPYVAEIRQQAIGLVSTPRPGGMHWYVPASGDRGNRAGLLPSVDYRGLGGYVVGPPSINAHADRWRWIRPLDLARQGQVA